MTHALPNEYSAAARLLEANNLVGKPFTLASIPGGRNNKVWRLDTAEKRYLLKQYFTHPADTRDRLARETEFLRVARQLGCLQVPLLHSADPQTRFGLLEWIEGKPPLLEKVDEGMVEQASDFIIQLNARREEAQEQLQPASEACFAPSEHLALVERRIVRLEAIEPSELSKDALSFLHSDLRPAWDRIHQEARTGLQRNVPGDERCLSPSDFGFHNSLVEADGRLRFVDFEYGGWDDPAKLICDFANQPDMLLPVRLSERFRQAVTAFFPNSELLRQRVAALTPVLQVKWACICLNVFLSIGRDRAQFTHGDAGQQAVVYLRQLNRAREMLGRALSNPN